MAGYATRRGAARRRARTFWIVSSSVSGAALACVPTAEPTADAAYCDSVSVSVEPSADDLLDDLDLPERLVSIPARPRARERWRDRRGVRA